VIENTMFTAVTEVRERSMPDGFLEKLPSVTVYIVKKGDTLWKLAKRFNTTVSEIARVNEIEDPDLIYPGERLIILKGAV
ncbi:MAG: LysM peptidoglycan-binding domain-containing protein, partial [Firmicutes bacterium]|nr:LysM peptidoglycan-binding domain-containing protein [Bacillota bacterium]